MDEAGPLLDQTVLAEELQTMKTLVRKWQLSYEFENTKSIFDRVQEMERILKKLLVFQWVVKNPQKENTAALEKEWVILFKNKEYTFKKIISMLPF